MEVHSTGWNRFSKCMSFSVGHGTRVCFWLNQWCGDGTLKDVFTFLYGIARDKGATVADYLSLRQFHNMGCYVYMTTSRLRGRDNNHFPLTRSKLGGMLQIRFVGDLQKVAYLWLNPIIEIYTQERVFLFLGIVFGGSKSHYPFLQDFRFWEDSYY